MAQALVENQGDSRTASKMRLVDDAGTTRSDGDDGPVAPKRTPRNVGKRRSIDPTDIAVDVGERIDQLLEINGWSTNRLAGELDTNPQTVYRWQRGEVAPRVELLVIMALRCNVSVDWLLGLTDENDYRPKPRRRRPPYMPED